MQNTKETTQQTEKEYVAGRDIGVPVEGVEFTEANPAQNIPSFVPGKNFAAGMTLTGRFVRTDRVYSDKFTAGKKDTNGKTYRDLHILEDMKSKELFGIWSVGILSNFFDQVPTEAPVKVEYLGLAEKALKPGQSAPHDFKLSLGGGYRLQRRDNTLEH